MSTVLHVIGVECSRAADYDDAPEGVRTYNLHAHIAY